MTATGFVVSAEYAWCLMVAAAMALQVLLQGFAIGRQRKRFFSKDFFTKNFPKEQYPKGGYPDMGNGRYSQKLSMADWKTFNNYQRAHYNYVEGVASAITLELICGLFRPGVAVVLGLLYIVGRMFYAFGYRSGGPKGRTIGAITLDICLVGLLYFTVTSAFAAGGGVNGFVSLIKATGQEFGIQI